MPFPRRRLLFGFVGTLLLAVVVGIIVLGQMFPSRDDLHWPEPPTADGRYRDQARTRVLRLLDAFEQLRFERTSSVDPTAIIRTYKYLRDSPYLPATVAATERVFSIAAGSVLLAEDLSQVKHANSVYEGRYALYMPTGDTLRLNTQLPAGATLAFGAIAIPDFGDVQTCPATVTLTVLKNGTVAQQHTAHISADPDDFSWRDTELALGAVGDVELVIQSQVAEGCDGLGHVFLSDPTIWAPTDHPPLNVLYINICTLRADDLGTYGQPRPVTPAIDAFAQTGVVFETARSNANWSKSSQMSALLGRYPSTLGVKHFRSMITALERHTFTHLAWPSLASILRTAGYETAALADNVFLADYLRVGVDLGFARFVDNARHIHNTADIVADTVHWLERSGDRPFFYYLNLANPHYRYRPPREYLSQIGFGLDDVFGDVQRALHLGEVAYTDDAVGRLLDAIDRLGLRERTLIVFHADHGETLEPERDLQVVVGSTITPRKTITYPTSLYKHGWTWQETEVRIPMIFASPGHIKPARRIDAVTNIDVAPTILGTLGISIPPTMHGRNLFAQPERRASLIEGKQFSAVVDGHLKYVQFREGMTQWQRKSTGKWHDTPELLFDLAADPGEQRNLIERMPLKHQKLAQKLATMLPPTGPLHILVFEGPPGTKYTGTLTIPADIQTLQLRGHRATDQALRTPGGLQFSVVAAEGETAPVLAFSARSDSPIKAILQVNGQPLPSKALLIGPHGLPLLAARALGDFMTDPSLLSIGAGQRPTKIRRDRPTLRWWTQRVADGGPEPWRAESLEANIMDAMKDWGYAQ